MQQIIVERLYDGDLLLARVGVDRVLAQLAEQLLLTPEVPGLKIQSSAEYVISVRMPATEKIFRTKRKESNLD